MATNTQNYIPFGPEWEKEMMKFPKKELIQILKTNLKIQQIHTSQDAKQFIEACIDNFSKGKCSKQTTIDNFNSYTARLQDLFWKNAKLKIKENPELLNS